MRKTLKKAVSLLMVLVMLSALLPMGAFAEDGTEESVVYENEEPAEETAEAPEDFPNPEPEEPSVVLSEDDDDGDDEHPITEAPSSSDPGHIGDLIWYVSNPSNDRHILKIEGNGPIPDFDDADNKAPWSVYCAELTGITVDDGVTAIGAYSFKGCTNITALYLSNTLTSVGAYAFAGCTRMSWALLQGTATTVIGAHAFDGCGNLRTLSLPATLASVGDYAFSGCNANIEVTYDGAPSMWTQVEKGEDIGFSDSSIQFSCMASGTQGDLLAWDISNSGVLTISGTDGIWNYAENDPAPWADYADRVTGLVICEGVRSIGTDAFIGFTGITEVAVPSTVGFIGLHAFDGCSGLTTLSLPAGLELIESYAFRGCALTTVNYNGSPSMWAQIEKGTEIGISDDVLRFAFAADGTAGDLEWILTSDGELIITGEGAMPNYAAGTAPWYDLRESILSVVIENGVTSVGNYAFSGCGSLEAVVLPESLTAFGQNAFQNCTSLTEAAVPGAVGSIGFYTFAGCTSLERVTLGNGIEFIASYAFEGCTALREVGIPQTLGAINYAAFNGCAALERIDLPATFNVVRANAFAGCTSLTVYYGGSERMWNERVLAEPDCGLTQDNPVFTCIDSGTAGDLTWILKNDGELLIEGEGHIPDYDADGAPWADWRSRILTVTLGEGVDIIGEYAFSGCQNLTRITLPTTMEEIWAYAFEGDYALQRVEAANLKDWLRIEFHGDYFNCSPLYYGADLYIGGEVLTHAVIPEDIWYIHECAFAFCDTLTEVTFGDTTYDIGYMAFFYCHNLKTVNFPGSPEEAETFKYGGWIEPLNDELINAQWVTWDSVTKITPKQAYLILAPGESHDLKAELNDETYQDRIFWLEANEDGDDYYTGVINLTDGGTVTALRPGTAHVIARLWVSGRPLTAMFRIDVVETAPAAEIESIRTTKGKATVKLYSTDYAEIPVIPVLAQNASAASLVPEGDLPEADYETAAITSAKFTNSKAAELFDLVVRDDRALLIVPKYSALEQAQTDSKSVKDTYKSKIEITVGEGEQAQTFTLKKGADDVTLELTVKQAKPKITASAGKINSAAPGHTVNIRLKGGTVTAIELDPDRTSSADIAVDTEHRTVRLAEGSALVKGTRKVYLLATVEGWAVKVPVTLKVSAASARPTIKFGKTTLTVTAGTEDRAHTTMKVTPAVYTDHSLYFTQIVRVTEDGVDVTDSCGLGIALWEDSIHVCAIEVTGVHTFKVRVGVYSLADPETPVRTVVLTVRTRETEKANMTLKASGKIDLTVPGSPVKIKATFKNYTNNETYTGFEDVRILNDQGDDVTDLFDINFIGNSIRITERPDSGLTAGTYTARVTAYFGPGFCRTKTVEFTVKKSAPSKVPVSVTAKATGSIDVLREASCIRIRPKFRNYYADAYEPYYGNIVITKTYDAKTKKAVSEDVTDQFEIYFDSVTGEFVISAGTGGLNHKDKFTYRIVAEIGGKTVKTKAAKLSVKQGSVKVKQSVKTGTLYRDDRYGFVRVDLTVPDSCRGIDYARTLAAFSSKYFDLRWIGEDTFLIGYKDNAVCPVGTRTVKIKVFLKGNESNTANRTVSIDVTVK